MLLCDYLIKSSHSVVLFLQVNTNEQNVSRCCDIVELNARVQSQLFKLLSLVSHEGRQY